MIDFCQQTSDGIYIMQKLEAREKDPEKVRKGST